MHLQKPGFQEAINLPKDRNYHIFSGTGSVNGMDAMLQYENRNYTGWIAYTLSESKRSFDNIRNGISFPAQDDRRHQLKWVNNLRFGRFDISANYIFSSGRPYVDLSKIGSNNDRKLFFAG